jgi:hypothetical protein
MVMALCLHINYCIKLENSFTDKNTTALKLTSCPETILNCGSHSNFFQSKSSPASAMSDLPSPGDIRCIVLRHLFRKAKKTSACPLCLLSRSRYDKVKEHCERERNNGDEIHERLISENFPTFHSAYAEAIGWKCPKAELRLSSARSASFNLDKIIELKLRASGESEIDLLLQIAEKSAMGYICPYDLATFKSMQRLRNHLKADKSEIHTNLASQSITTFIDTFTTVMGRRIIDLPLGSRRPGPPSPIECLKTGFVMKEIDTEKLVNWYNENKHLSES